MNNRNRSVWMSVMMCSVLFLSMFAGCMSALANAPAEDQPVLENEKTTDYFGGGSYVGVRHPYRDAWAAVVYGTQANPNGIVFVAMYTRYLGGATVYDQNGALVSKSIPIPVKTYFAMSLEDLYEFDDTNDNGIGDVVRSTNPIRVGQIWAHEPVYKSVSLDTAWTKSVTKASVNGTIKEWSFSLTATNLSYTVLGDPQKVSANVGDGKLNSVTFTLHMYCELKNVDVQVPWYKVTVQKNNGTRATVLSSEQVESKNYTGSKLATRFKCDHDLVGWDFDPSNSNPGIVLESHALFGFAVSPNVAAWYNEQFIENNQGDGRISYETDNGSQSLVPSTLQAEPATPTDIPQRVKRNELLYNDKWQNIGKLTWVSNVDTYANESAPAVADSMYYQVQGGRKLAGIGWGGFVYRAGVVLGGFSYPGAYRIYHDPEFSSDMNAVAIPTEVGTGVTPVKKRLPGFEGLVLIGAIAAVVAVGGITRRKKE